jgi:DNA modification methylase
MRTQSDLQIQLPLARRGRLKVAPTASSYEIHNIDAFEWLKNRPMNSIEAVVTDPPYGLVEYTEKELGKRQNGKGGIWRLPPAFDGSKRMPLPRFTVLTESDQESLRDFLWRLASLLKIVLVPGGHVFIATNPLISHFVYDSFIRAKFEKPFKDLIQSSPARKREREIAPHPSLKPQSFLRQIVRASLPLSKGTILDPFMGSGSTIAAATACGLKSIGIEVRKEYFTMAETAIPLLAQLKV